MTTHTDTTLSLQQLCEARGGKWYSRYGVMSCPVCQSNPDKTGVSISYGRKPGVVVMQCRKMRCSFKSIIDALRRERLWPVRKLTQQEIEALQQRAQEQDDYKRRRADELWEGSLPIVGTLAEQYLRQRGIDCKLPESLRFLPSHWHAPSESSFPVMLAGVTGPCGFSVHRTYLDPLTGQKANIEPAKAMLGRTKGGGVVLARDSDHVLAIAEGIENGLSLKSGQLAQYFGPLSIVAATSAANVGGLALPQAPDGTQLVIACDGDSAGQVAAHKLTLHAESQGWIVHRALSPAERDYNDILKGQ